MFDTDTDVAELVAGARRQAGQQVGNEYKGIATIRAGNGITDDVSVEVICRRRQRVVGDTAGRIAFRDT